MPPRTRKTTRGDAPPGLAGKRPALVTARDDEHDRQMLAAEVEVAEEQGDDGSVVVTLQTAEGDADIRVPPLSRWRSTARNALFSRGDDMFWAAKTLSQKDAQAWADLDPTQEESQDFFQQWGELTGMSLGNGAASNRASRRMRTR